MVLYILGAAILLLCFELYRRYFPILGITCRNDVDEGKVFVLDIRDYNEKASLTKVSMQIPYAYLRRNYHEIPAQPLHVIAANRMELNLSLRFLLRKGYRVRSFEILDCPCREKGGIMNGI